MLIKDVCKETGLTKKAIEYYQQKGLISPEIRENGYRDFDKDDVEKLKKVALLRKLGLSIEEINKVLSSQSPNSTLREIKYEKEIEHNNEIIKLNLLDELIQGKDRENIENELNRLLEQSTIKQRLLNIFPGYYGRFVSIHFGKFLDIKLETEEQKEAYKTIVEFLDSVDSFKIPADLQKTIDDITSTIGDEFAYKMSSEMTNAVNNFDDYYNDNKEMLEQYIEYKKTKEYRESHAARLMELFREFGKTSGYYDVFIPAMRRLSPLYNDYYEKLLEANKSLIEKYPEIEKWT